ncbi:MAG: SRPBCC family protein [Candidatus Solibacter sp.]
MIGFCGFGLLFISALGMALRGYYGWTLFIMLPVLAGGLGTLIFQPRTAGRASWIGVCIGAVGCALFLVTGVEGFICVLMALPVAIPLAVLGSLLAYWGGISTPAKGPAGMALLLPVSLFFDITAKPPVYPVTTSIVVNAAPERVWQHVVAFPKITAEPDWLLRPGMAYPIQTRIAGSGVGAPRSCDLSTGTVQERVVVWDEPRRLRFDVTATPPAMREMGLYGPIFPKHLEGYYISEAGQFELTRLPGGRTLVAGTSWYRHGLWPAAYWRLWSDAVVHHIHRRVLEHIRALSETGEQARM